MPGRGRPSPSLSWITSTRSNEGWWPLTWEHLLPPVFWDPWTFTCSGTALNTSPSACDHFLSKPHLLPPPHSQSLPSTADSSFMSSCVEEDEQEHETSSQPSMSAYTPDAIVSAAQIVMWREVSLSLFPLSLSHRKFWLLLSLSVWFYRLRQRLCLNPPAGGAAATLLLVVYFNSESSESQQLLPDVNAFTLIPSLCVLRNLLLSSVHRPSSEFFHLWVITKLFPSSQPKPVCEEKNHSPTD